MRSNIFSRVSNGRIDTFALGALAVLAFMIVMMRDAKVYDISTAGSFALGLGWMARGKLTTFYSAFPLMCLNRETTGLLSLVFIVYFAGRMPLGRMFMGVFFQASGWMVTRFLVTWLYGGNQGQDIYFRLWENLQLFTYIPWVTVLHWSVFGFVMWRVWRSWKLAPRLLRCAWLVLFPILFMEYLVFGFAFEVRVFAELWAVLVGISVERLAGSW